MTDPISSRVMEMVGSWGQEHWDYETGEHPTFGWIPLVWARPFRFIQIDDQFESFPERFTILVDGDMPEAARVDLCMTRDLAIDDRGFLSMIHVKGSELASFVDSLIRDLGVTNRALSTGGEGAFVAYDAPAETRAVIQLTDSGPEEKKLRIELARLLKRPVGAVVEQLRLGRPVLYEGNFGRAAAIGVHDLLDLRAVLSMSVSRLPHARTPILCPCGSGLRLTECLPVTMR